jgi:lysophospholipase L1-like esterase
VVGALLALLAAGCASAGTAIRPAKKIVVAALGDSITAGSPGYDPDRTRRKLLGFGGDEHSQWEYWAERKDPRLVFRNCGIYGQRTDEIAERLASCAKGADVLVVQGGINDIAQGVPVEAAARNLEAMVRHGRSLGLRVALADLLPWNNGYPAADPKIRHLNRLLHSWAGHNRVTVLPFYATLDDPEQPGRMPLRLTSDGDHPSVAGYRLLGERAFRLP